MRNNKSKTNWGLAVMVAVIAFIGVVACQAASQNEAERRAEQRAERTSTSVYRAPTTAAAPTTAPLFSDAEQRAMIVTLASSECGFDDPACMGGVVADECYGLHVDGFYQGRLRNCVRQSFISVMQLYGASYSEAVYHTDNNMPGIDSAWSWYSGW